ncbi:hypothetical protein Sked_01500 [Sanguibacter keddieii DSM 10542]|uniref:DUF4352 domain-containing protein n=1 Tax=Sanguibacter keddieii (strain ATCC 51767 / DSM 10542 / NCFB 3025 / ST-74) TaxID=446469 RepID=D1BIT0_SANKS|nr:hypothetical protein [Sanguibacter keddieii]ACZ20122.1 hypothetical protein Sked_01500 [Sanguibacter keddieii DSM 10542]
MRITRGIATLSVAGLALAGLTACSSDDADKDTSAVTTTEAAEETTEASDEPTEEPTEEESEEATDEPTEDSDDATEDSGAAASGDSPEWAVPTTTPGDKIATIEGTDFTVDVYQVGTATASKTGQFVDPETNLPLIAEGDEIVYINYVMTNTGSEEIPLSYNLVSVTAEYADWPYLQGMDSIVDSAQFEEMDVTSFALAPGSGIEAPFAWAPGQTFSYGQNFKYQAGSPITFDATLTPSDDAGDLVHDEREEVSVDATIS